MIGRRRVSLVVVPRASALMRLSALGLSVAAAALLVAAVLASGLSWFQLAGAGCYVLRVAKQPNTRHNKALHPTAASLVLFAAFRLDSKLVVIGRRRVSLALCRCARVDA